MTAVRILGGLVILTQEGLDPLGRVLLNFPDFVSKKLGGILLSQEDGDETWRCHWLDIPEAFQLACSS